MRVTFYLKQFFVFCIVILCQLAVVLLGFLLLIFISALLTSFSGAALFFIFVISAAIIGLPLATAAWAWEDMINKPISHHERILWCLIVAILWIPGLACYFIRRSRKMTRPTNTLFHSTIQ